MKQPPSPHTPLGPTVPISEPEAEHQAITQVFKDISERIQVFGARAINDLLDGTGTELDSNGFIVHNDEPVQPYTFDDAAFTSFEGVSDQHLIDYFNPTDECFAYLPRRDRLHITDVHSFVQGTEETEHMHPVPDDEITIRQYHAVTSCVMPNITAWSSVLNAVLKDETRRESFRDMGIAEITAAVLTDPPELSCLRCGFTGEPDAWDSTRRHKHQEYGYGNVFTCPECDCQWSTSGVRECGSCSASNTSEELEYIGEGMHVEALCKSCESVVGHGNRVTRYNAAKNEY